jgi:hypothetical protein
MPRGSRRLDGVSVVVVGFAAAASSSSGLRVKRVLSRVLHWATFLGRRMMTTKPLWFMCC